MAAYFSSLDPGALFSAFPGGIAQGLVWGIMALGVFITYRILNFADLSVDGSLATGGATTIMLIYGGWDPVPALIIALITGLAAGLITGLLHTLLGIPDILAGILVQISLYSINLSILGKANQAINVNQVNLPFTSNVSVLGKTIIILIILSAVLITLVYFFMGTEVGSAIRATGINPNMSRAQGINTGIMKVIALAISNGLVALAGGILAQYQGFADVNMGRGAIVIGLAAVIIGEVLGQAIVGKRMNFAIRLVFVILGGVIYYLVYVFVLWLKFPANSMKLLTAIVVTIFLAVPYLREKRKTSFSGLVKRNAKADKGVR